MKTIVFILTVCEIPVSISILDKEILSAKHLMCNLSCNMSRFDSHF